MEIEDWLNPVGLTKGKKEFPQRIIMAKSEKTECMSLARECGRAYPILDLPSWREALGEAPPREAVQRWNAGEYFGATRWIEEHTSLL